jgi:hypothetical protein
MRRRVIGGIAGWIIGALPLIAVNIATYSGFYIDNPVLIGAIALLAGLILGGIISGYIGGSPQRLVSGGAIGAGISGGISAVLYAVTTIALVAFAPSLGGLPALSADQLAHTIIAVLFFAALLLGISMLAGVFAGRGQTDDGEKGGVPRQPGRMYNNPRMPSGPVRRDEGRSQPTTSGRSQGYQGYEPPARQGERYYDDRRYQATNPGRLSGPRNEGRDPSSR